MTTILEEAIDTVDRQTWLDPVGDVLQEAVSKAFATGGPAGQWIKNFLHGVWLEHPLHPVLTDIPIGAWWGAAALDGLNIVTKNKQLATAADAAVAVGLAGAAGSIVAGLNDWQHTDSGTRPRRVGLGHGLLNISATLLYGTSFALRLTGARGLARGVSLLGFAVVNASALLGGDLVFEQHIGVDHAAGQSIQPDFKPVLPEEDLPDDTPRGVDVDGVPVLLVRQGDRVYALADTCSHLACLLSEGTVAGNSIKCPCHGSRFSLEDGRALDGPSTYTQPRFDARIHDGQIEVRGMQRLAAKSGQSAPA